MRSLIKYLLIFGLFSTFLFTSCKEDAVEPTVDEFSTLAQYLVNNNLDMNDLLSGWVSAAGGLNVDANDYAVPDYYVIDLRAADDFDAGHIKDAHNTTLANVLLEAENANGKPILAVCYTGQTSARATAALKLMGYDAKSLKWGMSGWHGNFAGPWENNVADVSSPNWIKSGDPVANQEFSYPSFKTGFTNGADILKARVDLMLNQSGWSVNSADVLANPNNYFVNNKWPIEAWDAYGHVAGARRINEDVEVSGLKWLDPSQKILTYCYTGQTSSITAAWLNVLGYDALSMKFGVNSINHAELKVGTAGDAHKKSWKGEGSGSINNFGYYDNNGNFFGPE